MHKKKPINSIEGAELSFAFLPKIKDIKYVIRLHGGHHFFAVAENREINKWKGFQEKRSFKKADAIISSLPLANFPETLRTSLIQESHTVLNDNAQFIQFQYSLQSKKKLEKTFEKVSIRFTPLNFPPAFIYTCTKTG